MGRVTRENEASQFQKIFSFSGTNPAQKRFDALQPVSAPWWLGP
jgi:hypothetical protein